MKLESFAGLGVIPIDVLQQGTRKIVEYMLDLYRSPDSDPLYRCKLMVVGFAEIGKSTLLDCLFPFRGNLLYVDEAGDMTVTPFELQGNLLKRYAQGTNFRENEDVCPLTTLKLNNEWNLLIEEYGAKEAMVLEAPRGERHEFIFDSRFPIDEWLARIGDIQERDRTHGIEIREVILRDHNTHSFFEKRGRGSVELPVWDFAGQHDFYNSHHHFLSTRSLFLVLWNIAEYGKEGNHEMLGKQGGLSGLEFWFSSLGFHLTRKNRGVESSGNYFSVIVVGTHFDLLGEEQRGRRKTEERIAAVMKLAGDFGVSVSHYVEVSCVNELSNIGSLQDQMSREILGLKCMGEILPKIYLKIEDFIQELRVEHADYPIVDIAEFYGKFGKEDVVKRALSLLSKWGKCVYFEEDAALSLLVVLDPQFLSKKTLAGLFRLREKEKRKYGMISHRDLVSFWPEVAPRIDFEQLIRLMEAFDVCFVVPDDKGKPFLDQRSILPGLLPMYMTEKEMSQELEANKRWLEMKGGYSTHDFQEALRRFDYVREQQQKWKNLWPDRPHAVQKYSFESVFQFGAVPAEIVSRVIARLYKHIVGTCVFRNLLLLQDEDIQCKICIDVTLDRFYLDIRARSLDEGQAFLQRIKSILSQSLAGLEDQQGKPHTVVEGLKSPISELVIPRERFSNSPNDEILVFEDGYSVSVRELKLRAGLRPADEEKPRPSTHVVCLLSPLFSKFFFCFLLLFALVVEDTEKWNELEELFSLIGGEMSQVAEAYCIENPSYVHGFNASRMSFREKHKTSPGIFCSKNYRQETDGPLRQEYLDHLDEKIREYPNSFAVGQTPVLPMIQGADVETAWKIAGGNFGIVASRDVGYYGMGIYFSSRVEKALQFGKVLIVALVNPAIPSR